MIDGKAGRLAVGIVLGLLVGTALATAVLMFAFRDTTPELTEATFEAAQRRWDERGPQSYDMDLAIEGNRPGTVHVEVRDGKVTHMMRDGTEPKQSRTWGVWAVPGQFETIEQELDKAGNPAEGFQAPAGSRMVQRALFDPHFGYPAKYHRIVLGSNLELRWQVTRFVPLDARPEKADGSKTE
jgi:hypothetical protein